MSDVHLNYRVEVLRLLLTIVGVIQPKSILEINLLTEVYMGVLSTVSQYPIFDLVSFDEKIL